MMTCEKYKKLVRMYLMERRRARSDREKVNDPVTPKVVDNLHHMRFSPRRIASKTGRR